MAKTGEIRRALAEEIESWGGTLPGEVSVPGLFLVDVLNALTLDAPGWVSVKRRLPDTDRNVLAVKELKSGLRDICIARCIPNYPRYHHETKTYTEEPYWVCNGNNNIIYWTELPEMPDKEA